MLDDAIRLAGERRDEADADLFEELRIPSISALPDHAADVRRNAEWLRARFEALGMTTSITDVEGGRHPVLRGDLVVDPSFKWLTIYGHYDVQPADPLDLWETPPFEPTVRDGHVYARGSSDNKGNHMAALKAIEFALAAGGLPVNVRFLIEGEEEITGISLGKYARDNAEHLRTEYILVWDGGFTDEDAPSLVTGLRGILYVELEAQGPAIDLHSGSFGGVAPNPLNSLAHVLSGLKGKDGRITIPGFYDDVRTPDEAERASWQRDAAYAERLKEMSGATTLEGEAGFSPVDRQWIRPTLDVHGVLGGFVAEGEKTVIPARAMAKVSMRLVPDQDPDRIEPRLREYVRELSTPGVRIDVKRLGASRPVLSGADHDAARAATAAFTAAFGKDVQLVRAGGSIPVAIDLQEALGAQMVISGLAQPGAGAHSPNEKYSLDHYHRGIEMLLRFVYGLG